MRTDSRTRLSALLALLLAVLVLAPTRAGADTSTGGFGRSGSPAAIGAPHAGQLAQPHRDQAPQLGGGAFGAAFSAAPWVLAAASRLRALRLFFAGTSTAGAPAGPSGPVHVSWWGRAPPHA
ncbi:hypothetical protein Val02_38480 [Virgisporangium aliadipatigenens]|uniref:Secreted protein n=1 Tax=Virgisporangium aliadipatigenens TaxID=741659 RepID=A0A8J4DS66_9ACTN|nr:hypothetical protein [Virgisporangium aliadipatigenens]GIJ46962.1 hypothetical protein Val02_38480 [Virgisporangium aliadipatigenens]